jgi:hypothetical protein
LKDNLYGSLSDAAKAGRRLAKKHRAGHRVGQAADVADSASQVQSSLQNREFVDDEDIFERAYDVEAREPGGRFGAVVSVFSIHA